MANLAVIPARGGSKRIPRKNIRPFMGKPIIQYPIEASIESGLFEEIMVSTEDEEIMAIARHVGASTPFSRSVSTANDFATLTDVLIEVLTNYEQRGDKFDTVCMILPTTPFITVDVLRSSFKMYQENETLSALVTVVRFEHPIERAMKLDGPYLEMKWPENSFIRSQDFSPSYHDAGQFYWLKTADFLREKAIFLKKAGAFELDEMSAQDIDNEAEWRIAELKYQILKGTQI